MHQGMCFDAALRKVYIPWFLVLLLHEGIRQGI